MKEQIPPLLRPDFVTPVSLKDFAAHFGLDAPAKDAVLTGISMNTNDLRPGDLIVNVFIRPNSTFRREGNNLIFEKSITVWDAILGAKIAINTLDNKNLNITIPPGTQPDTVMSCNGEGLPDMRTKHRGNLLIRIKVSVPRNLTHDQYQKIQELKNGV